MSQPSNLDPLELRIIIKGQAVRLHLHEDEFLSNIIRRDGFWEMPQTKLLVAHVKKTDVILDIGANLGYYTVIAAKLASEGVVHAFEPDPANFALLERNCALNGCGNAVLHQMALSSESGPAQLFQSARNKGDHRLASSAKDGAAITIAREVGDVVLQALPRVDVIKCDTQGAEADVFAGLESLMARSVPKPLMLVEFEPTGLAAMGRSHGELLDRFDRWGYSYNFVYWENVFPIRRSTLMDIGQHWLDLKFPGNLDLVLSPA